MQTNEMSRFLAGNGHQLQIWVFVILFIISWNIENAAGAIFNYKKWKHAFLNAPFLLTNIPGQLILGWLFIGTINWVTHHHFGILFLFPKGMNFVLKFLIALILLDFGEYIYHVIMHKVTRLWMFHMVHHSDNIVDVSTTFREHPGENIIRLSFTLLWVFFIGVPFWMLMFRQTIQAASTLFDHINYRLPDKLDKIIGILFITPNLHQVHHHYKQPYTDCNYGDVFSIWDRIFGTFRRLPAEQLLFGVDTVNEADISDFAAVLRLPFTKYPHEEGSANDQPLTRGRGTEEIAFVIKRII